HIQGSGVVKMTDGSQLRVNYAEKNGHRYYAIGRTLIKEKLIPIHFYQKASMSQEGNFHSFSRLL
ncbi:MAG: MltA domain-containing protein, partial [Bacteroidota bacterium]